MKETLLQRILSHFGILWNPVVGIDLGSSHTLVWIAGNWWQKQKAQAKLKTMAISRLLSDAREKLPGLALYEDNVALLEMNDANEVAKVAECGAEATRYINRPIGKLRAFRPIAEGVMQDSEIGKEVVVHVVKKAFRNTGMRVWGRPTFLFAAPKTHNLGKLQCLVVATAPLKPKQVYLATQPLCGAVSSNIMEEGKDVTAVLMDNGGGNCHVSIVSSQGEIVSICTDFGGDAIDQQIINGVLENYSLAIEEVQAKQLKHGIVSALTTDPLEMDASGYHFTFEMEEDGVTPKLEDDGKGGKRKIPSSREMITLKVSSAVLQPHILKVLNKISDRVRDIQDKMRLGDNSEPSGNLQGFLSDLAKHKKLLMIGAGSQMRGLAKFYSKDLGYNAEVLPEPALAVIRGASCILMDPKLLERHAVDKTYWLESAINKHGTFEVGDDVRINIRTPVPKAENIRSALPVNSGSAVALAS